MKNIQYLFFIILLLISCNKIPEDINITNLRLENKILPTGVDISKPRFSWNLESDQRGIKQAAYQVLVASTEENIKKDKADMWDSGRIVSDNSIQIFYKGEPLQSNRKYYWKVKIWSDKANSFESEPSYWTTGLFNKNDWKAKWIGLDKAVGDDDPNAVKRVLSARMLRKEFNVEKKIKKAVVFISGLGLYELYLNGRKVGDQVLAPALSEYNKTTFYNTFNVTDLLNDQRNAIGLMLGNGRYFAPRTEKPTLTRTFGFPKAICQLEIEYTDGSREIIKSDKTWKLTANGPVRKNSEYDGEYYDARMEIPGWNKTGFDDSAWYNAQLVEKPGERLVAQPNEPIKIMEEVNPVSVKKIKPGVYIFDMGQNIVGWTELFVKGKKGDRVRLRFAETLNDDGSLFMANLRGAEVTDTYILKGEGKESWEPKFTYHGFRYVEMKGYPGKPTLQSLKGKVIYDALETTGAFSCSNPLINKIYKNAYWGIRGNYRSMPTDCPQRDERQGWLGDRSAESTGESYIFNISNLYAKWISDMRDAQLENGSLPDVAPSFWPVYTDNTTWPGTYLFASDMLYTQYGDLKIIKDNYPNMQKWISHMQQYIVNGIMSKDTYGDWCSPPEDPKLIHTVDPLRTTSSEFLGTAYFYFELKLMAKFAHLLDKENDANSYEKEAEKIKKAFNNRFLNKKKLEYANNSHTVNILALAFGLVPMEHKEQIINKLLQKIMGESKGHVGNGIVGGQWLMRTLTSSGHADVAYLLAAQNTYPSWGYMVKKGATTIWELWNGDTGDPGMNSGNHVMLLGDLIIWFYENLAGIKPDPEIPAFKHILMSPSITGDLKHVEASYKSVYGTIKSSWKLHENTFSWDISIPANTTATVSIPVTTNENEVMESGNSALKAKGIDFIRMDGNLAIFEIVSGNYSFFSKGPEKIIKTKGYVSTPLINPKAVDLRKGDQINVRISCDDKKAVIHYTLDGSFPDENSPVYKKPFIVDKSTTVRAQAFKKGLNPSISTIAIYDFINPVQNGVRWKLYKGDFIKIPDLDKMKPDRTGYTYHLSLNKEVKTPKHFFTIRFTSKIRIDKPGMYKFYTSSNDGSKLYIDGKLIVNNDGLHGPVQKSGETELTKGMHNIQVDYFQGGGSKILMVYYSSDDIEYRPIPGYVLFK